MLVVLYSEKFKSSIHMDNLRNLAKKNSENHANYHTAIHSYEIIHFPN